ncbi:hypothetical protein TNCV_5106751 [Trichonephila clavipes]|uniref:Uncharacterized protein n=1 Tax=Trichonephila clavipes TaxID=2585209 RepID=A0A8X6RBH0_TRICX|nr:hypothetical protein TNCV_5106751 [Trichonephila clavipes]
MTLILRLLEQIDVSRMVDINIRMQTWKKRVKKIDFMLKWLRGRKSDRPKNHVVFSGDTSNRWRDGQVYAVVGQGIMALRARRLGRRERKRRERGARPWMEKREKPCPGLRKHERRALVGTDGKRALKKRA